MPLAHCPGVGSQNGLRAASPVTCRLLRPRSSHACFLLLSALIFANYSPPLLLVSYSLYFHYFFYFCFHYSLLFFASFYNLCLCPFILASSCHVLWDWTDAFRSPSHAGAGEIKADRATDESNCVEKRMEPSSVRARFSGRSDETPATPASRSRTASAGGSQDAQANPMLIRRIPCRAILASMHNTPPGPKIHMCIPEPGSLTVALGPRSACLYSLAISSFF